MRDLTFENPLYAKTKRYSRYKYTNVPPYIMYYRECKDGSIYVPVGYDLSHSLRLRVEDKRVQHASTFPKFVLTLRDDQAKAFDSYLHYNSLCGEKPGKLYGCVQMPTGKGKSILGLRIAAFYQQHTLIVVHKDDLITGWQKDIAKAFAGALQPGLIKAQERRLGKQITLATVQTLNRLSPEELAELYDHFGFVIQDEMHHCPASMFQIVSNFKARYRLGLTATPERSDGLEHVMQLYFGEFASMYEYVDRDEDILPVQVITRTIPGVNIMPKCRKSNKGVWSLLGPETWFHGVASEDIGVFSIKNIAYVQRPKVPFATLDSMAVRGILPTALVDIVQEYTQGRSCVVFLTQKEDCRAVQEALIARGVIASEIGMYYGDTRDNDNVLKQAEAKRRFITITTYAKATEGTNVTRWEVAFFLSSMNNERNVEQAAGRIRRTRKDGDKLECARIYDYRTPNVYSLSNHGRSRDTRYAKLKFRFERGPTITRGFGGG